VGRNKVYRMEKGKFKFSIHFGYTIVLQKFLVIPYFLRCVYCTFMTENPFQNASIMTCEFFSRNKNSKINF